MHNIAYNVIEKTMHQQLGTDLSQMTVTFTNFYFYFIFTVTVYTCTGTMSAISKTETISMRTQTEVRDDGIQGLTLQLQGQTSGVLSD